MDQGLLAPGDPATIAEALGATIFGVAAIATTRPLYTPAQLESLSTTVMQMALKGLR